MALQGHANIYEWMNAQVLTASEALAQQGQRRCLASLVLGGSTILVEPGHEIRTVFSGLSAFRFQTRYGLLRMGISENTVRRSCIEGSLAGDPHEPNMNLAHIDFEGNFNN